MPRNGRENSSDDEDDGYHNEINNCDMLHIVQNELDIQEENTTSEIDSLEVTYYELERAELEIGELQHKVVSVNCKSFNH